MEEKYINIIIKKGSGEASLSELMLLQEWLNKDPENAKEMAVINAILKSAQSTFETYQPDTAGAWEKLRQKIKETPEKRKRYPIHFGRLLRISAVVGILAVLSFLFFKPGEEVTPVSVLPEKTEPETIEIFSGDSILHYYLPDSSGVTLNVNSILSHEIWDGTERKVKLIGEAFFVVKKDTTAKFIVFTEASELRVLGTSFRIRAYKDEEFTEVEVEEGKIELLLPGENNEWKTLTLEKNEQVIFNRHTKEIVEIKEPEPTNEKVVLKEEAPEQQAKRDKLLQRIKKGIDKKIKSLKKDDRAGG